MSEGLMETCCNMDEEDPHLLMAKLYKALMKQDKAQVLALYESSIKFHEDCPLTTHHDTILHVAIFSKQEDLIMELLDKIVKNKDAFHVAMLKKPNGFGDTVLHEAVGTDMTKVVDKMLEVAPELLTARNILGETPLFRVVHFGQTEMLKHLAHLVSKDFKPHERRKDDATILHIAILNESFDTAAEVLNLNLVKPQLIDGSGLTCLQLLANMPLAFKSGSSMGILMKLVYFCLPDSKRDDAPHRNYVTKDEEAGISEQTTATGYEPAFSRMRHVLSEINKQLWCCLSKGWPAIQEVWTSKKKHDSALELVKILVKTDESWMVPSHHHGMHPGDISIFRDEMPRLSPSGEIQEDSQSEDSEDDNPERKQRGHITQMKEVPLLAAARHGIIEIIKAILEEYPQAVEYVNDHGANILHAAVRNRRTKVFDFLSPYIDRLPRLAMRIDCEGNSLLHQVAVLGDFQAKERPGEALHMQWEIEWFKKVKKIVPHHFLNHLNNKKLTSQELFSETHKDLVKKGQEWLMCTSRSCSVVAALIATVAFTSAYTVPGGNHKNSGQPVFLKRRPFLVFTVTDATSLSLALTSLVVFLSIMTARFHEQDFHHSLPLRLVLGLTSLFLAVASMMVAFAATLVLMVREKLHWAAIPIYLIACYPVTIFLGLQFPLYVRVAWFTLRGLASRVKHSFDQQELTPNP